MIQVNNLSYSYPKAASPTLHDISFTVEQGEIFGFLGPSGAGKSTTQKVLNGILKGFNGDVRVNGHDLKSIKRNFYEEIGVAFEFPNLYPRLTALENLQMYASFYNGTTVNPLELLSMVNLSEDKGTRVEAFSKGMKMRLNFIRALINNPKVIFLDEPVSGLDPVNAKKMKNIILDLRKQGKTIFLTTHNMADADQLCDKLAFMVDGKLPIIEEPRTLKLQYGKKMVKVEYRQNGIKESLDFDLIHLADNKLFQSILKNKELETIHTQEATLEDVFIQITGQKLSECNF